MADTEMKSKERVKIAMMNDVPDCVPVIPQICYPHAVRALGMDYESTLLEVVRDPLLGNRLVCECAKQYGVDGFRAWIPPDPADTVKIDDEWYGCDPKTGEVIGRIDFEGGGGVMASEEPAISTEDDIDRIPVRTADEILASGRLDGIKSIIDEAGDDFFIISNSPEFTFQCLTFACGKEQAMMEILDRPDFCHKVLEKALLVAVEYGKALAAVGIDAILLGDTFGGIISPNQFSEFCVPYLRRFVDAMKGLGPLVYLHICGNSTRILEMMADTGVDCIEPLDPLGGVEVHDAKRRVGSRVAIMGGVNTVTLAQGTLEEANSECRRCLDEGAPGGGYILAAGDMLPTETSSEKVEAMVEHAHGYRYD